MRREAKRQERKEAQRELKRRRLCPVCGSDMGYDLMEARDYENRKHKDCERCGWNPDMSPEEEAECMENWSKES